MDRRPPTGVAAGGRGAQRVRRRVGDDRRPALLPDPGRREGLCGLPDRGPRDVGPRLDAARRQRGGPGRRGHRAARGPGPDAGDAGHGALPRARGRRAAGRGRPHPARPVRRRSAPGRGGHRGRLRSDVRPRPARAPARHDQPGRRPCRGQVQRHPRRRRGRGRLPRPARHDRARHARRARRAARAGARGRLRDRAHRLRGAGRVAGRGTAVRPARRDDPRPRSRRDPAAGHGAVRDRRQAHRRARRRRRTASRRSGSTRTSASSSGSTGSTSASRSRPCAGVCRSSTTWSAASAAEACAPLRARQSRRRRLPASTVADRRDLLSQRTCTRKIVPAFSHSRSGSWSPCSWCWRARFSKAPSEPSS